MVWCALGAALVCCVHRANPAECVGQITSLLCAAGKSLICCVQRANHMSALCIRQITSMLCAAGKSLVCCVHVAGRHYKCCGAVAVAVDCCCWFVAASASCCAWTRGGAERIEVPFPELSTHKHSVTVTVTVTLALSDASTFKLLAFNSDDLLTYIHTSIHPSIHPVLHGRLMELHMIKKQRVALQAFKNRIRFKDEAAPQSKLQSGCQPDTTEEQKRNNRTDFTQNEMTSKQKIN
eukprot:349893-Chlamydomonas_euryale.AAC.8